MSEGLGILLGVLGSVGVGAIIWYLQRQAQSLALGIRPPSEMVIYQPPKEPVRLEPVRPIADPNSTVVMQSVGQLVSSLRTNEAVDIEHTILENGQRVRFARVGLPPLVRPLLTQEDATSLPGRPDALKKIEKDIKKIRNAMERQGNKRTPEHLDIDGVPCLLMRTEKGYDLVQIMPDGSQKFMAHLGVKPH